jgi:hypothetical protein
MSEAFHHCLKGAPWERRRERLGYMGLVRVTEVTFREENGWHPHAHALLFLDRPIGDGEAGELGSWLLGRWGGVCERRGFGTLSAVHGVDVQVVREAGALGQYLTKVEGGGGWDAGHELARGDSKTGREGSMVPFEMLAEFCETGEARWARLFQEYDRATFGKQAMVWTPGLEKRLLGEVEAAKTDEDLAAAEGMEPEFVRFLVDHVPFWEAAKDGSVANLLTEIEDAGLRFWRQRDAEVKEAEGVQAEGQPDGGDPGRVAAVRPPLGHGASPGAVGTRATGVDAPGLPDLPGGAVALVRWPTSAVGGLAAGGGVVDAGPAVTGLAGVWVARRRAEGRSASPGAVDL